MTTVIRGDDNFDSASPLGANAYTAKAWVTYSMTGTASISADAGVSSLTDSAVGSPQFSLSNVLPAANGTCWNTTGLDNTGTATTRQSGGRVFSTASWEAYCGGNTSGRQDWDLGYSGLIR